MAMKKQRNRILYGKSIKQTYWKKGFTVFLTVLLAAVNMVFSVHTAAAAEEKPQSMTELQIDHTTVKRAADLVRHANLIVHVHIDSGGTVKSKATSKSIGKYQVVRYVQPLEVLEVLKDTRPRKLFLLTEGLEPLPAAKNPLNRRFTGPLADGNYILFLKMEDDPVSGMPYYTLIGDWQSVYPLLEKRTIALHAAGFNEFGGLTVSQLKKKIKGMV